MTSKLCTNNNIYRNPTFATYIPYVKIFGFVCLTTAEYCAQQVLYLSVNGDDLFEE